MASKKETTNPLELLFGSLSEEDILANSIQHSISKEIIKKRLSLGLTQSEYAKTLGVSQGMLSKWESGDYNFTIASLAKIACLMELNLINPLRPISVYENAQQKHYDFTCNRSNFDTNTFPESKKHCKIPNCNWAVYGGIA